MANRNRIKQNKDRTIKSNKTYWDFVGAKRKDLKEKEDQLIMEDFRANPDQLPMQETASPSTPQLLMGEAVEHLQGRQREVYIMTMREGKSLMEAAKVLGIEKGTAQVYKGRAIKFIESYCKVAIAKGRV